MKATQAITLRVPSGWQSLGSADVRSMLADYLQRPTPNLPADPGPGDARLSLSLPARAVKVVSALLNENETAALRRIIAASRGLPSTVQGHALLIERPRPRVIDVQPEKPRALLPASGDGPPAGWEPRADAEWRRTIWANYPPEYKARLLGNAVPSPKPKPQRVKAPPEPLLAHLWACAPLRILFLAFVAVIFLAVYSGGAPRRVSDSPEPKPGPRFRPWSPKT
ncbi:MAG: hypothetical protein LAN84_12175 [Acidobacteriia bacterium]|nr:hypothetical protein [Terriglobia bacterium]